MGKKTTKKQVTPNPNPGKEPSLREMARNQTGKHINYVSGLLDQ